MTIGEIIRRLLVLGDNRESGVENGGLAALFLVVVIGSVALMMAYGATWLGLGELEIGYTQQKGEEAAALADGCVEESLRRVRLDNGYGLGQGTVAVMVEKGGCAVVVTEPGVDERRIEVTGWVDGYYQRRMVDVSLSGGGMAITGWKEM